MRYLVFALLPLFACTASAPSITEKAAPAPAPTPAATYTGNLPLDKIKLPPGFKIGVYAENIDGARSLCLSPGGTLFVSTRDKGKVYAIRDTDGDHAADQTYTLASGLNMPNGVAFRNGSLFVAEVNRVIRFDNIEKQLSNPPAPVVVWDKYPSDEHHGWKYIAFGPDGKLYVPVGAPCNICESENPIYGTITRLDVDKPGEPEIVQRGIRNTVGFNWHPLTKELWFTDNGRDWLGDDLPACELNHASKDGMHFGYPYCHQGDLPDPKFGEKRPCSDFTPPVQKLGAHVAPLGLEFYQGKMFPAAYRNQVFIAEHGSWNRAKKSGYKISLVKLDANGNSTGYETFASGWLQDDDSVWGRPVDLEHLPDGSLLVSDDHGNAVYRIWYEGK